MSTFLFRRLSFFLLTLLLTSILIFLLTRVLPGDVARALLGQFASPAEVDALNEELGFNDPLVMQYLRWAGGFIMGEWGETFTQPRLPIREVVARRGLNSLRLALVTLVMAVPLSIGLGVAAGLREGRPLDDVISVLSLSVVSLPEFVTGLFLINILALGGRQAGLTLPGGWWFPPSSSIRPDSSFAEALPALWLPAAAATFVLMAYLIRLTRASVIEELKRDYVSTAVFKGLPARTVVIRHVLRNALIPTITVIATSTGWLFSGMVVIEYVFSYPGLGSLLIDSITSRDLLIIQAIVMVTVTIILAANFSADLLYAVLNPRIRLE